MTRIAVRGSGGGQHECVSLTTPSTSSTGSVAVVRYRLDLIPLVALGRPLRLDRFVFGPYEDLRAELFVDPAIRRTADQIVAAHRDSAGKKLRYVTVMARDQRAQVQAFQEPVPAIVEHQAARALEAFRYLCLRSDRMGWGPNSTHLHHQQYSFTAGSDHHLTVRSRYVRFIGISNPKIRPFLHMSQVQLRSDQIDAELTEQLGRLIRVNKPSARRIWRALWWFNDAHQDHPYERIENSILALASAFEALLRPQPFVRGQTKAEAFAIALATSLGVDDLSSWAQAFYRSRSQIIHGDEDWSAMFGPSGHVSHYRVARKTFQEVLERRVRLILPGPGTDPGRLQADFMADMRARSLARMVVANGSLMARFTVHDFASLQLRRNARFAWEISVLPVLLNDEDVGTPSADYARMLEWLRSIAVSGCRSGAQRWRADAARFHELRREFERGVPALSGVVMAPAGADFMAALEADRQLPERRPVLGHTTSVTDLAEAMRDISNRIDVARLRERST